jgi:hypothetical protein
LVYIGRVSQPQLGSHDHEFVRWQAEEIGVEHLLRDIKDTTVSTLAQVCGRPPLLLAMGGEPIFIHPCIFHQ